LRFDNQVLETNQAIEGKNEADLRIEELVEKIDQLNREIEEQNLLNKNLQDNLTKAEEQIKQAVEQNKRNLLTSGESQVKKLS
jgi:hypothetical protein